MAAGANVTITREANKDAQEFVLHINGARMGSLDYAVPEAGVMRIDYVEVAPELRGSGLVRELVQAAVDWARAGDLRIVPICGYARAVMTRDPLMRALLR